MQKIVLYLTSKAFRQTIDHAGERSWAGDTGL